MGLRPTVVRLIRKLAYIGIVETDGDAIRAQKATLTIAAIVVTAPSCVWVGTYVAPDLPQAAAIPFAYQLASVASLIVFARTCGATR